MNPLIRPWRQMFNFSGRATRTEYGLYHLSFFGGLIALEVIMIAIIAATVGIDPRPGAPVNAPPPSTAVSIIGGLISLLWLIAFVLFLIGHISVSVRRQHDAGEPGAKYLLTFIPLAGIIFWAIMVFTPGDFGENDYGPDPRNPEATGEELGGVFS